MTTTTEAGYVPMRNDRRDFDPMGEDWHYILDDGGTGQGWRELVAVNARRATWPFALHEDRQGRSYGYARLSPDWAFYSWGNEYLMASWDAAQPHQVRVMLTIGRDYPDAEFGHRTAAWSGQMVLDLLAMSYAWDLYPRDADKPIPDDVAAEATHKGAKLLAFFTDACGHWRAGDQPKPVQAYELVDHSYVPPARDDAEAEQRVNEARELHANGRHHDLELCGLKHDIDGGLMVVRERGQGWRVVHAASGKAAHSGHLRLKRYASEARAELLATGVDFTRDAKAISKDHKVWREVYFRWSGRAAYSGHDPETGEWYRA